MKETRLLYAILLTGLLITLVVVLRTGCQPDHSEQPLDMVLKNKIKHHEQARDSAKAKAAKTEENQKVVKKTYRNKAAAIGQTDSPCRDTIMQIIQLCDTVILTDSVLIAELKEVIKHDSLIIDKQKQVIRADSLTIVDLTKSVKREKRKKTLAWIVAGIAGGINLVRP